MIAFLVFGITAYKSLPVSDLPNVDFPTISVSASLPGASPETMASAVATPLEKQFSTIAGVDQMTSTNQLGSTQITLQFALDRNLDAAAQDVQSMIAKANRDLPRDMPAPPSYQKVNPADQPILYMAVSSPTMRLSDVDEYAETTIAQTISQVSGVAQVSVFGAQKYAVRAQLDPRKMASAKVGIDEVTDAVQNANVNMPTGTLWGSKQAFTVQANGQLMKANQYRPLIVAYRNGKPIRLEQIANVFDSVENDKNAAWFGGRPTAITLSGARVREWRLAADDWKRDAAREHALEASVKIAAIYADGEPLKLDDRLVFLPDGLATPFRIALEVRGLPRAIEGDASGAITLVEP
jgi:HAE1 family hydrophobic/amphiphilic exporter-1